MSETKTPVIGHVTPANGEPICLADDRAWEALAGRVAAPLPPNVKTYPLSVLRGMDDEPGTVEQPDAHAQRLPTPNDRPAIVDLVLARLRSPRARAVISKRDEIGQARYGTRLQAFNGRDVERDMTDEAADAVNYAMQGIQQATDDATRAKWERRFAMAEALLEEMVDEAPAAGDGQAFDLAAARAQLAESERQVAGLEELARVRTVERAKAIEILTDSLKRFSASDNGTIVDLAYRLEFCVARLWKHCSKASNSRDRWQARARKAEARVAVLTQDRDGLTLRLGRKERKRVRRGKAKAGARKGGRR